jgi:predicted pyridoxine 5'-phosphate oxidase superfamily flavin-nucleotide-binding protein
VSAILKLDEEYRLVRAAVVNAGVDMTDSMDALYRDWRRWRDKLEPLAAVDSVGVANADQWWAHHLAQFRRLIDPLHVAARAERARKDRSVVRARPHTA